MMSTEDFSRRIDGSITGPSSIPQGWQCPACKMIWAPTTSCCNCYNNTNATTDGLNFKITYNTPPTYSVYHGQGPKSGAVAQTAVHPVDPPIDDGW